MNHRFKPYTYMHLVKIFSKSGRNSSDKRSYFQKSCQEVYFMKKSKKRSEKAKKFCSIIERRLREHCYGSAQYILINVLNANATKNSNKSNKVQVRNSLKKIKFSEADIQDRLKKIFYYIVHIIYTYIKLLNKIDGRH